MIRYIIFGFLLVFGFSSCQNDDEALPPGARPDERLELTLSNYKAQLVNAPYGWKGILYPGAGAGYNFYFVFQGNDRVIMYSDINETTASISLESTYRLKAMQRPSLLFDTYSYIHLLSDPDPSVNGGVVGAGKFSDFEFAFDSLTENSIELVGNFHGSRLVLEEATQEEAMAYIPDIAENITTFEQINNLKTYFKRLTWGGNDFDMAVNTNFRSISFSYLAGNIVRSFVTSYYYTRDGITLLTPFEINGVTISALNTLQYSAQNNTISFSEGGTTGIISAVAQPLAIDTQAALRFYNNPANGLYWETDNGFTIEGEEDALGVGAMENFVFSVFWPKFGDSQGTIYDIFGFIVATTEGLSISGGPAFVPQFPNDGRLILNFLGTLGEIAPEDEAVFMATTEIFADPAGFYVIQTSEATYDLVSADDATKWISFY